MRPKHKFYIDTHKGANALAVLALIAGYDAWHNETAWLYLALHGTYGLLWIWKSLRFPDKQWEQEVTRGYGLLTWFTLTLYWVGPWIIVRDDLHAAPWLLALCVSMWGVGVFLHFGADMQKHMHLKLAPGTLLTDGLWARSRNPITSASCSSTPASACSRATGRRCSCSAPCSSACGCPTC
ncbi:hypothetical protein [Nannocystis pusilla]|uniref:hypothetical protein n=1 Tax=Nannocystis pusilla TaxID=889268 RepID=UPI003B7AB441